MRERERERERQTDRQTDRQTERDRERQRDRVSDLTFYAKNLKGFTWALFSYVQIMYSIWCDGR